jgi:uncharacterized membrane protein YbhN (UPF0104 family)
MDRSGMRLLRLCRNCGNSPLASVAGDSTDFPGPVRTGAIVIICLFFNVFLPGLVGGDLVRLYYIFRLAPRKKLPGSLSIVMDRLLGLLAIVFLSAIVLVVRFNC